MIKNRIIQCTISLLCLAVLASCSGKSSSDEKIEPATSQSTSTLLTDATTEATHITTTSMEVTAETTTAITTTVATDATEIKTKMLDRIADSMGEPTEITSPFGDISNAYVCFGGTALYPSVHVLSDDEVKKLSKVLNSMEWSEFPDKPKTPDTPGSNDLILYVNDNGKRSQLTLSGDIYRDENGYRYFMIKSPSNFEENFTLYQICDDLLYTGDLKNISTHLSMLHEIRHPDGSYDINEYWDLIWDDVIHNEEKLNDNIQ